MTLLKAEHQKSFRKFLRSSPAALTIFIEILIGIFLTASSFLLFAKLSDTVLDQETIVFDSVILNLVHASRTPLVTRIMLEFTNFGSFGIFMLSGLIVAYLLLKNHKKEVLIFSLIVFMGAAINALLKVIIQRPRPIFDALISEKDYSFPSGHSMDSMIFFLAIIYLTYHFTGSKHKTILVALLSFFCVFMIGLSRVYLGVHYPSDILGGYLAGLLWFLVILLIDRTIVFYRLFKES